MTSTAPVYVHSRTYTPDFIVRLQTRDIQAVTTLYDDYSGVLFALTCRATGDSASAEYIFQNAFVKIWLGLPHYSPEKSALYTWMMSIARNEIVDHYRVLSSKQRAAPYSGQDDEAASGPEPKTPNKPDVKNITKGVSANQKVIFELLYFQGYSFGEIANQMKMPVETLKTQVMAFLRKSRGTMDFLYLNNSAHTQTI
jgi:RNA polymerase sigma-70 factor (ECF subfamily)